MADTNAQGKAQSVETPEADAAEQERRPREEGARWPDRAPLDANPADAAEQERPLREEGARWPDRIPLDANPADAAEQELTVELDEDDYR